jgi:hypothetical protein
MLPYFHQSIILSPFNLGVGHSALVIGRFSNAAFQKMSNIQHSISNVQVLIPHASIQSYTHAAYNNYYCRILQNLNKGNSIFQQ